MTEHEAWLRLTVEDPIDPALSICSAHHHLWDMPNNRYLMNDLFKDIGSSHKIVRTVFVESRSMSKRETPQEIQPVRETKFAHDVTSHYNTGQSGLLV